MIAVSLCQHCLQYLWLIVQTTQSSFPSGSYGDPPHFSRKKMQLTCIKKISVKQPSCYALSHYSSFGVSWYTTLSKIDNYDDTRPKGAGIHLYEGVPMLLWRFHRVGVTTVSMTYKMDWI